MTFLERVEEITKNPEFRELNGNDFNGGVRASREALKPTIDKIMEAFEEIKKYIAVESLVGQKLKAAIKDYKELEL